MVITDSAKLHLPPPSITSSRTRLLNSQIRENTWNGIPRSTESRYSRTVHGVVPTALSAGEATVAAIRAAATDGTKSGTNRCARLVIGCATR
jgi:hypothetical protein